MKYEDKLDLASNTTDPEVLDSLSFDKRFNVKLIILANSNTSIETIKRFLTDKDEIIRDIAKKRLELRKF